MSAPSFIFFGTPYVARDTLSALVDAGYVPKVVVTSPDAPAGRGQHLAPCETKAWALERGLIVMTPEKITPEFIASLSTYEASYAVVVAYGKILPQALIDAFPLGILNVHYSLLPKYRGASPVEEALLQGDHVTGVVIQQMAFELDAGDVLASKEVEIMPTETTRGLRPRLVAIGSTLLIETLPSFIEETATKTPQHASEATFSKKIRKEQGELTLSGDAYKNWNTYRAYAESPGTYFFMEHQGARKRVKIRTAWLTNGMFMPLRVVPEGKQEMNYSDLLTSGWTPL